MMTRQVRAEMRDSRHSTDDLGDALRIAALTIGSFLVFAFTIPAV